MTTEDTEGMVPEEQAASEPVPSPMPNPEPEPTPTPEPEPAPTYAYDPRPSAGPAPEPVYEPADDDRADSLRDSAAEAARKAADWLNRFVPGHGNTILFGIVGLLLALLVFKIGVWRSFVVLVLVVGGMAFGQYLDGDPKILRLFRDLLNRGE